MVIKIKKRSEEEISSEETAAAGETE